MEDNIPTVEDRLTEARKTLAICFLLGRLMEGNPETDVLSGLSNEMEQLAWMKLGDLCADAFDDLEAAFQVIDRKQLFVKAPAVKQ